MKKLSELPDKTMLSRDEVVYGTVGELKVEIQNFLSVDEVLGWSWTIAIPQKLEFDANEMINNYVEQLYQEMYEDWDDIAFAEIDRFGLKDKIQELLNDCFSDDAKTYYCCGDDVKIDIFPPNDDEEDSE